MKTEKWKLGKWKLGKWKIVLLFFAVMFGCTILSRAADAVTLPRVQTGNAKSGALQYTLEGQGTVTAQQEELVFLPAEMRIISAAAPGNVVKTGDVLAVFDLNALEEKRDKCQSELKKIELNLEQEKLNGEPVVWQREQDEAQRKVSQLEEELRAVQKEAEQKRAEYQQKSTETDLTEEEKQEFNAAIEELELKQEEVAQQLSQAQEALELAKSSDEVTEAGYQRQRRLAEFTRQSLQIDMEEIEKEIQKLEELIAKGGNFLAGTDGTITDSTAVVGGITSGAEYFKIGNGNTILTAELGREEAAGLKEGDAASITSNNKKKTIMGTVAAIQEKVQAYHAGRTDANASDIAGEGAQMQVQIKLEENELAIGEAVPFKVIKESQEYKCLIPVSAIREDSQGQFVLIVEEKSSILGRETVAVRVDVHMLEKNNSDAAVESALTKEDQLILGSNKTIKAGDKVRKE